MSDQSEADININMLLSLSIEELVVWLFPNAVRKGSYFRLGSIEGERGRSLGIKHNRGGMCWWRDWAVYSPARGHGGDMIQMIADSQFFGVREAARRWAWEWLGLGRMASQISARTGK